MSQHRITATRSGTVNGADFEEEWRIVFSYSPGHGAILHPADVAHPGEPPSVELVRVEPEPDAPPEFMALARRFINDWATDWLEEHEAEAIEVAHADIERDREAAAEARAELRREDRQ